ncbi:hypothetical protein GCM10023084_33040 [Streptomyces lacrimifluminis]|uniref:DUF6924 domain-containing protein n=1 Tax=Streptomyces lacrimifluminis TaxID=1500077 RepID=A0A917NVC8_9ACTN|nr:hypothetical protein [Streptomyces lacrimifluminis]GGJ31867.1 hypothetical protein GCM10012282_30650 [Streptomyces lacrimifluminis]
MTEQLPHTSGTLVLRTDFAGDAVWEALTRALATPSEDGFLPSVELVADPRFTGVTAEEAIGRLPAGYEHPILVLADTTALASAEFPLLVVDLREEPGRCLRVVASELWGIENNLSIANMDFREFAAAVDADGVHRGF